MSEVASDEPAAPSAPPSSSRACRRRLARLRLPGLLLAGGLTCVLAGLWLARERIADAVIADQLRKAGLPGTYRIDRIAPGRQVLSHVVIGDPRHPDLVIDRVEVEIGARFGLPGIDRVTLVHPRLYGRWDGSAISFGALDKVLFGPPGATPFRLPDFDLTVLDGRGRIVGDHGAVGLAFAGRGGLRGGFSGALAALAPSLDFAGCRVKGASLVGTVSVAAERPAFSGPLRLDELACAEGSLAGGSVQIDARGDAALDGGEARLGLVAGPLTGAGMQAAGLNGAVDATWRKQVLAARYDGIVRGLVHPQLSAATVSVAGQMRARAGLARFDTDGSLDARGLRPGAALNRQLAGYAETTADTLLAPLLRQMRQRLDEEARGSRLRADYVVRRSVQGTSLTLPQGRLTGGSGATLLALSRLHYASGPGAPRLAGNFATAGRGLPEISGRLEQGAGGRTRVRMSMADYRAGDARLAVPELVVDQTRSGALVFTGRALASGRLPGGQATNLAVPLDGARSAAGVMTLWRACTTIAFDRLALANLELDRRSVLVCPPHGGAIVRSDAIGTRIAAGAPSLDLSGRLGATPVRIASGPMGFGMPGVLYAKALDIALGPPASASRFRLAELKAAVGRDIAGTFAGTDLSLAAVPLDLGNGAGQWRYADGRLVVSDATFRLTDRAQVARFQPLAGEGATLTLQNNRVVMNALLREPQSRHDIVRVAIEHDLASARGHADLAVDGIVFDKALQPDMLTRELLGVVANTRGTVRGSGRIDWTGERVTSSGRFATDSLDFAAALGPVRGVAGEVRFTDLIGLVTPPGQRLTIASINPGIEVLDGVMTYQLKPGAVVAIEGGSWPLLGGTLQLRPVDMRFGVAESRRFVLDIAGLDAAKFLTQMDLPNISATGRFDGTVPLVFDENGGRVDNGLLTSRPPGGNVSYVGALTYKDLSPVANFAFDALKSLDYRKMTIAMDGDLAGEIVTRVRFDGVKQGAGAKRNFLTQRFAKLPLQFNVNLRAPFYALIGSFKSLYDPAYIKDPRTIGLLDAKGKPVARPQAPAGAGIQPPVSEKKP